MVEVLRSLSDLLGMQLGITLQDDLSNIEVATLRASDDEALVGRVELIDVSAVLEKQVDHLRVTTFASEMETTDIFVVLL